MRHILFMFLLFPAICLAQAPKRTNLIIIPAIGNAKTLYKHTVDVLIQNGYAIDKTGQDSTTIQTAPKVLQEAVTINLDVCITDSAGIELKGNTFIPNVGLSPIENLGMKGSPSRVSWEEMLRISKLLGKSHIFKTTLQGVY